LLAESRACALRAPPTQPGICFSASPSTPVRSSGFSPRLLPGKAGAKQPYKLSRTVFFPLVVQDQDWSRNGAGTVQGFAKPYGTRPSEPLPHCNHVFLAPKQIRAGQPGTCLACRPSVKAATIGTFLQCTNASRCGKSAVFGGTSLGCGWQSVCCPVQRGRSNMIFGWPKGSGELLQVTSSLLRTSWAPFAPDAPHYLLG
jgi:hypothetical protein